MIAVRDLSVAYRKLGGRVQALAGVTVELPSEGIIGLIGRNGAGKSTLMRVLSGDEARYAGTVEAPRPAVYAGDRWPFAADQSLYSLMGHVARVHRRFDKARALELMDKLGLDPRHRALSRGQASAGLACLALAARAELTLLDEPTLGLDAPSRALLAAAIVEEQTNHPRCLVLSTHLIDESADLFERVLMLHHGRLLIEVDAEELVQRYVRVEGPLADVQGLPAVGGVERLGNHATVVVRRDDAPAHLRAYSVGLQELAIVLTEGMLP